jgi:hypothetical protein
LDSNRLSVAAWKIYLLMVVPATILLNLALPNFHAPDDYDHVKRAYTLFHEPFRAVTPEGRSSGAMIDTGLTAYIDAQIPLVKSTRRLTADQRLALARHDRIRWTGKQAFSEMPGALSFFPLLYAPQAMVLEIGYLSGANIEKSVRWARFANGFAGIALAAMGLYLLRGGQAIVLVLLLLPRTLLQFASNSADPILYGLALLIISLGLRTGRPGRLRSTLMGAALFISGTVRPPITALALTPAVQAIRERRWINLVLLTAACAVAALWMIAVYPSLTELRCGDLGRLSPKLRTFASQWPLLIGRAFDHRGLYYFISFVGHYGWGDGRIGMIGTPMPNWIYASAILLFGFALCQDLFSHFRLSAILRLSLVVAAACSVLLTFFAMYVGCTNISQSVIEGVQGRYFVTVLFAIAPAISGLASGSEVRWPERSFWLLICAWVTACTATMIADSAHLYTGLR